MIISLFTTMLMYSNYCFSNVSDLNSLTLCITPLSNNTGSKEYDAFAEGFSDLLTAALSDHKNIQIVDRQNLDQILKEQKLSLTDLIHPETALKIGRLLKADSIIIGGMTKPKEDFIINVHVYEIETSRLIISKMIQSKTDEIAEQTYVLANNLFEKSVSTLEPLDPNDIDKAPTASLHFMRGLGCFYTSDYNRSIVHFMKAVSCDEQYVKARLWMAKAYVENKEYEHARIELQKVIDHFPKTEESMIAKELQKELKP